ncbi:phytanoyl-CoA dioxygenase family protein [Roseomonas sp. KE2513]|uniref:phytanoyl-CoA dioxygenase family protein n=1 Tax=Roseomonas sp. KE2513 TaxID=2479202 RepID=UPI0018DFE3DD|nr:phytanoyl-CoA dioxygenase family protein [Roseomonas sp. KE2513]MBI0535513.1 phytanoyl-CoA dioxygenase family protein [Roseomonas sp. KE2513]
MSDIREISVPLTEGPLGAEDLAHYERTGWLAARGFFSAAEAAEIARWTDELVAAPEVPGRHMLYREKSLLSGAERVIQRIENFCPFHEGFDRLVRGSRLEAAAAQLMGGPVVLFKEKINFKMPGGAGFEPHQDQQAGWSVYARLFLTALVCIDRATVENGCLLMADAPRFVGLIGEEWRPLTPGQMAGFALTPVPTEPGDVLFFDSYVPHASEPNLTAEARRILYLTYNLAAEGDHRQRYFAEKRANFPPDIEREPGREYRFRV